jgi:GntR family transcriptional regulator, transcriptional repressor for pyruvate dehydrogenase complex
VALTDEAIEKIRQMIVTGRVGPGEKLPSETDLAAELGLSRSSLREAVRALSLVNVLEVRRGDGTYATSLEPSLLLETLSFIAGVHRDDTVLQFLEVRRVLEPAATALAAMRMPEASLAELVAVLGPAGANATAKEFVAAETEFHRRIAAGSGNPVLASLAESMSMPTARARLWCRVTEPGALERTLAEHRAIYGAIAGRDPDLARSWATAHIGGIESRLRAALSG